MFYARIGRESLSGVAWVTTTIVSLWRSNPEKPKRPARRQSQRCHPSRLVLLHEPRQPASGLIFDDRLMKITTLTLDRYDEALELMSRTPGVAVREADSKEAAQRYLARNPGLSFIAEADDRMIGCAMAGHDGRRGYIQHVVVEPSYRERGVAQQLVTRCLDALAACGISKTHLDVLATNEIAIGYWQRRGWIRRDDIVRFSFIRSKNPNA